MNILEDEYHFVLVCSFYSTIRDKYIVVVVVSVGVVIIIICIIFNLKFGMIDILFAFHI